MAQQFNIQTESGRKTGLAWWMTASIAVFVLIGSLALLWAFERHFENEERKAFAQTALANARFLERNRLAQSPQMATQLGEILGLRVFFRPQQGGRLIGRPRDRLTTGPGGIQPHGRVVDLPDGDWMVAVAGRDSSTIVFVRPAGMRVPAIRRRDTWGVLAGFWGLSLGLGIWLARRVTRPLTSLAESLPRIGTDQDLPPLPTHRSDEIGRLAQTLARTHQSLREERELRRAAERHALLGRMTASLAHEVRNPLAAIRLHAQLIENAPPDEAAFSRKLIESEAERIDDMVAQWLGHAKPGPPVLADVDLASVARQALELLSPQARHAGVELGGPEVPSGANTHVAADGKRLLQVLGNLLRNAVQATPNGGRVDLGIHASHGRVAIVIDDQGPGFSPTALARIGEPFYTEKEGGMGLGLAVAMDICRAHGGTLTAENLPTGGARVRAEFPNHINRDPSPPRHAHDESP
jgi:signal transduction histidine kinase